MKINYGDYSYYNPKSSNKATYLGSDYKEDKRFKKDEFARLIANGFYSKAAEYADNYQFNDAETNTKFKNYIATLKREGRKTEAIYSRIPDSDKNKIVFVDNVFLDRGLETIPNNPYTRQYTALVNSIAGGQEFTEMSITFAPKKRTLFGLDWASRDNSNTIENFYNTIGLTEEELRNKGVVSSRNKDGSTTLRFSRTNPYASTILYQASQVTSDSSKKGYHDPINRIIDVTKNFGKQGLLDNIKDVGSTVLDFVTNNPVANIAKRRIDRIKDEGAIGFVKNIAGTIGAYDVLVDAYNLGEDVIDIGSNILNGLPTDIKISRYDKDGNEYTLEGEDNYAALVKLGEIQKLIDENKNIKDAYFQPLEGPKQYSSTVGAPLTDNIAEIENMYQRGYLSDEQYRQALNDAESLLMDLVKGVNVPNQRMFTNYFNESTSTDLWEADGEQRQELVDLITSTKKEDITLYSMVSAGTIGTRIIIDAQKDDDGKTTRPRVEIFLPEFAAEKVQEKLNLDTETRATQELTDMQNYGYDYDCSNGNVVTIDSNTGKIYSMLPNVGIIEITKDDAINMINRDIAITETKYRIAEQFSNDFGEIIDKNSYNKELQRIAVAMAEDLYPNISLPTTTNSKGVTTIDIDSIFNSMTIGGNVDVDTRRKISSQLVDKYIEIFSIYNELLVN